MANPVIEYGYRHRHLDDTALVLTGSGILHTLTINSPDTTASATVTIYDGLTNAGVVIGVIAMDAALFVVPVTLVYDVKVATGIYVEFSFAVTADITVSFN